MCSWGLKPRGLGIFAKSGGACATSPNLLSAVVMVAAAAVAVATVAFSASYVGVGGIGVGGVRGDISDVGVGNGWRVWWCWCWVLWWW